VRALYFGTYDRAHPRNVNAIAALRAAGVEVEERQVPVRGGGLLGALNVFAAEWRLLAPRKHDFDVVIVGYPGHFDVPRARRFAGRRPLVFDAVLSLENELVDVRRHFHDRSTAATVLRVVDFRAFRLPNLVVCGTDAEARYLSQLGAKQTAAVFLGANEDVFCETWSPTYPFTALQIADASTGVVLDALALTETPVRVAEPGEIGPDARGIALAHAGIVLGGFHDSRAIPAVVFEALATGAPVITADTEAARELLTDGDSALLVEPASPAALAQAIDLLAGDEALRRRIAAQGREVFGRRASRVVLGGRWRELLGQTLGEEVGA
jgi:glycosyltransferase involved in cell wall biosynthesis